VIASNPIRNLALIVVLTISDGTLKAIRRCHRAPNPGTYRWLLASFAAADLPASSWVAARLSARSERRGWYALMRPRKRCFHCGAIGYALPRQGQSSRYREGKGRRLYW